VLLIHTVQCFLSVCLTSQFSMSQQTKPLVGNVGNLHSLLELARFFLEFLCH